MASPRFYKMLSSAEVGDVFFVETDNARSVQQAASSRASALGKHVKQKTYIATTKNQPYTSIQVVRIEVIEKEEEHAGD